MIAPLTRIVMQRDHLRAELAGAISRLGHGTHTAARLRAQIDALEALKAQIVIDGLLAQAGAAL